MAAFKIATWNVNSLRVRLSDVLTWLAEMAPDVLALQEIKMPDAEFPFEAIQAAGYDAIVSGQKTYNGVAILSRRGLSLDQKLVDIPGLEDPQRRILGVTCDQVRILNLYVPNGEAVTSIKYAYKLDWLRHLTTFLQTELQNYPKTIVLGDFNIAPNEIDVYNPKRWAGKVLFSEPERQAFHEILGLGFEDAFRQLSPTTAAFTWWDYRLKAYERGWGLRIDHILTSASLTSACNRCFVDKRPREWARPSDHAPVIAEFDDIL